MALAETIESVGHTAHSCCLELRGAIPLCTQHCLQDPPSYSGPSTQHPGSLWSQAEERGADTARGASEEQSEREEHEEVQRYQGPLPDLLHRNESLSWVRPQHRDPRGEGRDEVQRVANQLRLIGDDLNSALLHRRRLTPPRPLWRYGSRGLLHFISQTLGALYRLM